MGFGAARDPEIAHYRPCPRARPSVVWGGVQPRRFPRGVAAARRARHDRRDIAIDGLDFDGAVEAIVERAATGPPSHVVTPNAHHVVLLQRDELLREIYERAFLIVPDGVPLLWAARLLGQRLNGRVNGTDLFERLCARAAERGLRVFLLGGRPGAADAAAAVLRARHPALQSVGPPARRWASNTMPARTRASARRSRPPAPRCCSSGWARRNKSTGCSATPSASASPSRSASA